MSRATSKDGTVIAYEKSGTGPSLIAVDGALCSRGFGPSPKLAPLPPETSSGYTYDRRGRGESTDTQPYDAIDAVDLAETGGGRAHAAVRRGGDE